MEILGFTLSNDINVGNILTICSIIPGFIWWIYTKHKELQRQRKKDAESGSLRVILSLLRDLNGQAIKISDLKSKYNDPQLSSVRIAYCGYDFLMEDTNEFERAIYALDWEMKIDFVGTQHIKFKVDTTADKVEVEKQRFEVEKQRLADEKAQLSLNELRLRQEEKKLSAIFVPSTEDVEIALDSLKEMIFDIAVNEWEVDSVVKTAMLMNREQATEIIRSGLASDEKAVKNKAISVIGRLMSRY